MKKLISWIAQNSLYLLPLFFPLYLVKIPGVPLPINVLELAVLLLLLVQLGRFWGWGREVGWLEGRRVVLEGLRRYRWVLLMGLVFLIISVCSVLIVPVSQRLIDGVTVYESQKVAWGIWKGWLMIPLIWFVMMCLAVRTKKDLMTTLYAYIFSGLPLVIWAYFQYLTGDFITPDGRASGPFVNANYLSMYLAPAVAALWVMIVRGIVLGFNLKKFWVGVGLAALYSVALLMTQSYGAMLAVLAALALFMLCSLDVHKHFRQHDGLDLLKKISWFLGIFAVIGILAAAVLYAPTEKWKLFTEFQGRSSNSVRLQVYRISGYFLREEPISGIGLGQFEPLYNLRAPEILGKAPYEWVMLHPHNTFLAVWLNLGVIGFALFLWLLWMALWPALNNSDYDERFFRILGGTMLLVMLFHGLFDTYIFKNDLAMVFWLVMAMCLLPFKYFKK